MVSIIAKEPICFRKFMQKEKKLATFQFAHSLKNVCLHQGATKWYTNGGEPKSALMSSFQL